MNSKAQYRIVVNASNNAGSPTVDAVLQERRQGRDWQALPNRTCIVRKCVSLTAAQQSVRNINFGTLTDVTLSADGTPVHPLRRHADAYAVLFRSQSFGSDLNAARLALAKLAIATVAL